MIKEHPQQIGFEPKGFGPVEVHKLRMDTLSKETHCTITLLIQFLGMDTDKYIIEPLLNFLFVLRTCPIE